MTIATADLDITCRLILDVDKPSGPAHAGEDGPAENIRIAVEVLGCERIDHGFRLLDDPELTARVIDAGIPLTVCPTSNVVIAHVVPDAVDASWASDGKAGLRSRFLTDFDRLRAGAGLPARG